MYTLVWITKRREAEEDLWNVRPIYFELLLNTAKDVFNSASEEEAAAVGVKNALNMFHSGWPWERISSLNISLSFRPVVC